MLRSFRATFRMPPKIGRLDAVEERALMRHLLGVNDTYLIAHSDEPLSIEQSAAFAALVARRAAGEPIAYITGTREFFSLEFKVTSAVLIPRPETELLVEFALERIDSAGACSLLDLGTGSGCVAIAIAHARPRVRVVAVDASAAALEVARENAGRLLGANSMLTPTPTLALPHQGGGNLNGTLSPSPLTGEGWDGGGISFVQSNWFTALSGQRFDVIVSNPPYVAAGDPHLQQGDLRYEPASALVGGSDGLDALRAIIASASRHLNRGGTLALEHGHTQAIRCRELLAAAGFSAVLSRTDLAGIERVSSGRWHASS